MTLTSIQFFAFFLAVYTLYFVLQRRWQNWLLLAASYLFYASFDWRCCFLLLSLTTISWHLGDSLVLASSPRKRRLYLWAAVCINLGSLIFFKYFGFFVESANALLLRLGMEPLNNISRLIMPLGISFYVFQLMSYAIDLYRGSYKSTVSFLDFATYISFFPKLIAGPIERVGHFMTQLQQDRMITRACINEGFYLCFWGLYQKLFVADTLSRFVDKAYAHVDQLNGLETLLCIYAFSFQLYADFAGYSNIACGLGKLMGFDIIQNFRTPFFASNILEFWKRWHISLTSWLRDYVFYPFYFRTKALAASSILVFCLNGVWHGTSINFALMGLYWGIVVAITTMISMRQRNNANDRKPWLSPSITTFLGVLLTFHLNCFGFLLFRSETLTQIGEMITHLAVGSYAISAFAAASLCTMLFVLVPLLIIEYFQHTTDDPLIVLKKAPLFQFSFYVVLFYQAFSSYIYSPAVAAGNGVFIYFRF